MFDKLHMAHLHYRRGRVLEQAGRMSEAIEEYRQALQEDPQLRAAHVALAEYYMRHGLLVKAIRAWEAALDIEPDAYSLGQLAKVLIGLQRFDEADILLQECVHWWPDDASCQKQKAALDYEQGFYEAAYKRLIALRSWQQASWQVHHLLGWCQIRLGDYDGATTSFNRGSLLAQRSYQQALFMAAQQVVERLREFPMVLSRKEQLYTDWGIVCLGTSTDNGLEIDDYEPFSWKPTHVARTLQRFALLIDQLKLRLDGILALNQVAQPLAQALAHSCSLPYMELAQLPVNKRMLVVCNSIQDSSQLAAIRDRIPHAVIFVLSLEWEPQPADALPDVIGIPAVRSQLPWETEIARLRTHQADRTQINLALQAATEQLLDAWQQLPAEATAQQQLRWYAAAHCRHRLYLPD